MIDNKDDIPDMIDDCLSNMRILTYWERKFITDMSEKVDNYGYERLSDKQQEVIKKIHTKVMGR
jgi:hypothetical protein